jgi:hypothetical protein
MIEEKNTVIIVYQMKVAIDMNHTLGRTTMIDVVFSVCQIHPDESFFFAD